MDDLRKLLRELYISAGKLMDYFITYAGDRLVILRDWFAPFSDLRIIGLLLLLGFITIVGLDQGLDVVRGMSDDVAFNWRDLDLLGSLKQWFAFFFACVWTGLNAWFWSNILYITRLGMGQPWWFTWVRRFLGILPMLCAMTAILVISNGDVMANWFALLCFGSGTILMLTGFSLKHRLAAFTSRAASGGRQRIRRGSVDGGSGDGVYLGTADRWFVAISLLISLLGLLIFSLPYIRTEAAWYLGSAAIAFGAIGCIIPVTSIIIWSTREARLPVIALGMGAFILFSLVNDNHHVRTLPVAHEPLPTLEQARHAWEERHPDPNEPMVLIATAGGASRAAYWTAAVLRNLDEQTRGQFSQSVFAISSVSGGSLGAVGYAAWLSDIPVAQRPAPALLTGQDSLSPATLTAQQQWETGMQERRLRFMQDFMGADYLAPSVAGMLFPDMVQRFIPFPLFQDRAHSLEESWEMAWDRAARKCKNCGHRSRFTADFQSIWTDRLRDPKMPWVPLVMVNGTLADNGKRIITAPVKVTPDIFQDSYDFYDYSFGEGCGEGPCRIRTSTAVLNSARFPLVSPAGRLGNGPSGAYGHIIDGGYFENGGLETLVDILRFVRLTPRCPTPAQPEISATTPNNAGAQPIAPLLASCEGQKSKVTRPIIIIEISNDDRAHDEDAARDIGHIPPNVRRLEPGWFSPIMAGPRAIVGGLYNTSTARGISSAKRVSTRVPSGASEPDYTLSYFRFRLVPLAKDRYSTMSWALSLGTRDGIDLLFGNSDGAAIRTEDRVDQLISGRGYSPSARQTYKTRLLNAFNCRTNYFNNFQARRIAHRIIPSIEEPVWIDRKDCATQGLAVGQGQAVTLAASSLSAESFNPRPIPPAAPEIPRNSR